MALSDPQLDFWRETFPDGFHAATEDRQARIGGFIYACVFDGFGEPSVDDVERQIEADRQAGANSAPSGV